MEKPSEDLVRIAKVVRAEMRTWRESTDYLVIETFLGCVLARLLANRLIHPWEESILRQIILDDGGGLNAPRS